MLFNRLAVAFALGVMVVTTVIVGCSAIDPNPPHPHGDSGDDDIGATPSNDSADAGDGGEAGL